MGKTADEVIVEVEVRTSKAEQSSKSYDAAFSKAMASIYRAAEQAEKRIDASLDKLDANFDASAEATRKYQQAVNSSMAKAASGVSSSSNRIRNDIATSEKQFLRSNTAISGSLKDLAAGIGVGIAANAVKDLADNYTQLQNRLKVSGLSGDNLIAVQDQLFASANRNGVAVQSLAEVYQRASISAKSLGADQKTLLQFTDTLSNAVRVQGTTTEQASGALLQLSQALGAGIVRGEEFNSILEGLPIIAQTVAANIDRYAGSVSALRTDVINGKVTSKEFFDAILKGSDDMAKQAAQANLTIKGSFQVLNNELSRFVGESDQSVGASQLLSGAIIALSQNLGLVSNAIAVISALLLGKFTVAMGSKIAQSIASTVADTRATIAAAAYSEALAVQAAANARLTAAGLAANATLRVQAVEMGAATVAARGFGAAALGAFGGPVGLAITAVTLAIGGLAIASAQAAAKAEALHKEIGTDTARILTMRDALEQATNKTKGLADVATDAQTQAAALTGEVDKLKDANYRLAASAKAAAVEMARQFAVDTFTKAKQAAALIPRDEAKKTARKFAGAASPIQGVINFLEGDKGIAQQSKKLVDDAAIAMKNAQDARKLFDDTLKAPLANYLPENPTAKTKKTTKAEADRLAAQAEKRAELELQLTLNQAQADGDEARIRAAERAVRLAELEKTYKDAGVTDYVAKAKEIEGYENKVYEIHKADKKLREDTKKLIEDGAAALKLEADAQKKIAENAKQSLEFRKQIAQLRGDEKAVKAAERELYIAERIAELKSNNPDSTDAQNKQTATSEANAIDEATKYGKAREMFASAFSEGIRAVASGDVKTFLTNMVGSAFEAGLQKLGGQVFDSLFGGGAAKAATEGTIQGTAQGAAAGTAIAAASSAGAALMGSAITVAGQVAAASMAAAIVGASAGSSAVSTALASTLSFAEGGDIRGKGTGTSDSIIARVSNGEHITKAKQASKYRGLLHAINNDRLPGFASGGFVGGTPNMKNFNGATMSKSAQTGLGGMRIEVDKSDYFDVAVKEIAEPMALQAAGQGAQGGSQLAEVRVSKRNRRTMS